MTQASPATVLTEALTAAHAAARTQFEADGKKDVGSCGGTVLMLDRRTTLAKTAVTMDIAFASGRDCFVRYLVPEDVSTQHMLVEQKAYAAFAAKLREHGYENAIKKMWNYID